MQPLHAQKGPGYFLWLSRVNHTILEHKGSFSFYRQGNTLWDRGLKTICAATSQQSRNLNCSRHRWVHVGSTRQLSLDSIYLWTAIYLCKSSPGTGRLLEAGTLLFVILTVPNTGRTHKWNKLMGQMLSCVQLTVSTAQITGTTLRPDPAHYLCKKGCVELLTSFQKKLEKTKTAGDSAELVPKTDVTSTRNQLLFKHRLFMFTPQNNSPHPLGNFKSQPAVTVC